MSHLWWTPLLFCSRATGKTIRLVSQLGMSSAAHKHTSKQNLEADLWSLRLVQQLKTVRMNTGTFSLCSIIFYVLALGSVPYGCCLMIIRWLPLLQALLLLPRHNNGKGLILLKLCIFFPVLSSSQTSSYILQSRSQTDAHL